MVYEEYIGLADKPTYLEIAQSLNGMLLFVIIIYWANYKEGNYKEGNYKEGNRRHSSRSPRGPKNQK